MSAPASLLGVETRHRGDRTLVALSGPLGAGTEQALLENLTQFLRASGTGLDLDLSQVDHCDCAGLNVLLSTRRRALDEGKSISLHASSPAVRGVLMDTDTLPLFTGAGSAARLTGSTLGADDEDVRAEIGQLREAMQTRPVIDLARGTLMASFRLTPEDAWTVLVAVSQRTNTKLREVAHDLVHAVTGEGLPDDTRRQLAVAVAEVRRAPSASGSTAD